MPSGNSSPALSESIGRLAEAHVELERAIEADDAANELFEAWLPENLFLFAVDQLDTMVQRFPGKLLRGGISARVI